MTSGHFGGGGGGGHVPFCPPLDPGLVTCMKCHQKLKGYSRINCSNDLVCVTSSMLYISNDQQRYIRFRRTS